MSENPSAAPPHNRRGRYFIDARLQLALAVPLLGILAVVAFAGILKAPWVAGPIGTCPATGVIDPDTRAANRVNLVGPCNAASGVSEY
jgi:hypothetical protein